MDGGQSFHAYLTSLPDRSDQVASFHFFPPRRAVTVAGYDGPYAEHLAVLGLEPYRHQARALELVAGGSDLVIATPTASGKSLVFQLPVLDAVATGGTSIMLYPTKALAHDQLARLRGLAPYVSGGASRSETAPAIDTYDGDTPAELRAKVREGTSCVLTNPDMLHYGILPHHERWAAFLASLRFLVVDELHAYRGVLGSHVANVLRRLLRMARRYGADPVVIAASATVGNPGEHTHRLTGRSAAVIVEDDAPGGPKEFIVWRPPLLDGGERRKSANSEAAGLAAEFTRSGIRSIFFCNSRKSAELVRRYASQQLEPEEQLRIQSYRAGYTAEDRRLLESGFKNGDITTLTATSALELGMDIGGVDAVVMVGYPGSKMALWQRAGRAGRSNRRSLALLVPAADPLDEYYLNHPELLVDGPVESAVADPFNSVIHPLHLACAAAEAPLASDEDLVAPWVDLASVPGLSQTSRGFEHRGRYPHRRVSLRGTGGKVIRLKDGLGTTLGTSDLAAALRDLHPGAVYLHKGETYVVADLDLERGVARLLPHIEDYYTQPRSETDIEIIEARSRQHPAGDAVLADPPDGVHVGSVQVRHTVTSYVRKRYFSEAVLEERPLDLPEVSYQTQALWFEPHDLPGGPQLGDMPAALHALEHTLIQLLPAFVLCERADIGGVSYPYYPATGRSAVFIYDGYPGGVGYARAGAAVFETWLAAARDLLTRCPCQAGCPRCVLSPKCGNGNQTLDKAAALVLAQALLTRLRDVQPQRLNA
ncbi:MAG TPA: DEAD/DEAH box helicase [Trueperaceae bacterium]|nr:DEAD/DEAH box helicase [Trueperaceae bacterium]